MSRSRLLPIGLAALMAAPLLLAGAKTANADVRIRIGGKLRVKALCPSTRKLRVGLYGSLIDKSNRTINKGSVKITTIRGTTIHLVAPSLSRKSSAVRVRFWVSP